MTKSVKCPTCGNQIDWSEKHPFRPFCSERCRLIDLGAWADERYSIPTEEREHWSEGEPPDQSRH